MGRYSNRIIRPAPGSAPRVCLFNKYRKATHAKLVMENKQFNIFYPDKFTFKSYLHICISLVTDIFPKNLYNR